MQTRAIRLPSALIEVLPAFQLPEASRDSAVTALRLVVAAVGPGAVQAVAGVAVRAGDGARAWVRELAEELGAHIDRLVNDPGLRTRIGHAAYAYAAARRASNWCACPTAAP